MRLHDLQQEHRSEVLKLPNFSISLQYLRQVSNETSNNILVVLFHRVSELRCFDVLLVCLFDVFKLHCLDLQPVGFYDVAFKSQIEHQISLAPTRRETKKILDYKIPELVFHIKQLHSLVIPSIIFIT